MKPLIQHKLSAQDGSVNGSCFRTCLASILEVEIDSIPAFEDMGQNWHQSFFDFLEEHNLEFDGTGRFNSEFHKDLFSKYEGIDGYVIVGGKSPREWVVRGHAVLYKEGNMVHDPHPSGEGLTELEIYYMIKRKNL